MCGSGCTPQGAAQSNKTTAHFRQGDVVSLLPVSDCRTSIQLNAGVRHSSDKVTRVSSRCWICCLWQQAHLDVEQWLVVPETSRKRPGDTRRITLFALHYLVFLLSFFSSENKFEKKTVRCGGCQVSTSLWPAASFLLGLADRRVVLTGLTYMPCIWLV